MRHQYLKQNQRTVLIPNPGLDIPPKLPETTNFVLTNRRKEYSEINAMKVKIALENRIPPLKNLKGSQSYA